MSMPQTASTPKWMIWTGRVISALPALALIASGIGKLTGSPQLVEGFKHLGWPIEVAFYLGCVEAACALLYLIPQTAVLGAILMTGYLGGAVATHVRIGEYKMMLPAILLGVLVWLGLYFRDARIRRLAPLRDLNS
jgi:DoxX-like family